MPLPDFDPGPFGTVPDEDLADLYDNAPCGYLSLLPDGRIYMVNATFLEWTGYEREKLIGIPLRNLLHISSQIFYETHFAPLLQMQGFFNEVALDITCADDEKLPVLANAVERHSAEGRVLFTRISMFQAVERRRYERQLVHNQEEIQASRQEAVNANAELELRVQGLVEEHRKTEGSLLKEKEAGDLLQQFVAVLGHDLRNPLAAIRAGLRRMAREPISDRGQEVLALMDGSVDRMAGLIDDVMDFARTRLGNGLGVTMAKNSALEPALRQVIHELQPDISGREILVDIALTAPVTCDAGRIGQMVSNLLANALTHGDATKPIRVIARSNAKGLEISVINAGRAIPPDVQKRLFQPFVRGEASSNKQGLGLGLFIASEIAEAHYGTLSVTSDDDETAFTFRLRTKRPMHIGPAWHWPMLVILPTGLEVTIDGPGSAVEFLRTSWPFGRGNLYRLAVEQSDFAVRNNELDLSAYLAFRAAVAEAYRST